MELTWIASVSVSSLHAATALVAGRALVDPALTAALAEPAVELGSVLASLGEAGPRVAAVLPALADGIENNRELAKLALVKTLGRGRVDEGAVARLAAAIGQVEQAVMRAKPGLVDELLVRGAPLRQLWEARGPGLLHLVGKSIEPAIIAPAARVVLILPALGGAGVAHLPYNSVRIEAVLANPTPALPEVVRLAWLLAQLQLDLPLYGETIHASRLPQVAALAMLAPVLAAAQEVELAQDAPATMALALKIWLTEDTDFSQTHATTIVQWWETYRITRPRFAVALAALDKMLDF